MTINMCQHGNMKEIWNNRDKDTLYDRLSMKINMC